MLFTSFSYLLIFLPVVVGTCIALQRFVGPKATQVFILVASLVFYGWSTPLNIVFLIASILANWILAGWMDRTQDAAKKRVLVFGLILNVAYLCVFKYLTFLASMLPAQLTHGIHIPALPFPLGISFFTITQIMYLVDCYEGALVPGSLFDHATFVSFFPYVISGPLGRSKRMRHQFGHFGGVDGKRATNFSRGLFHFSLGLFKKAVLALSFGRAVAFGSTEALNISALEAWIFSVAYALQLYFDFSGYSDMAIGTAMMLDIDIPRNFDAPYTATSIIDFWQRWHISLTGFITSYLYTPILRAFKQRPVLARNMLLASSMATFFAMGIAGLWHGAAWTFIIYGLLHGVYLGINQYWRKKKMPRIPLFPSWVMTFTAVLISFTYFGASSVRQGTTRVLALFNPHHAFMLGDLHGMRVSFLNHIFALPLLVGLIAAFFGPSSEQLAREFRPTALNSACVVFCVAISWIFINSSLPAPFIYFRF